MKILFFDEFDLRNFGGKEKVIIEIAKGLSKKYKVKISSTDAIKVERISSKELEEILNGVPYERIKSIKIFKHSILLNPFEVFKLVKENDIIYCTSPDFFSNFLIILFSKILGKKTILGFHDPDIFSTKSRIKKIKRFFDISLIGFFDSFHILTKAQIEKLKTYKNKKFLIPNFYDKKLEKFSPKYENEFRALFIGRLSKQKGADLLPIIAKDLENEKIKFIVIGEGEEKEKIKEKIEELKLKNISLLGFVKEDKKIEELKKASLLIFPSRFETFPLTIVDALACGLPFVGFKIKEAEEISTKENSYLAKPFDVKEFEEGIKFFYRKWKEKNEYIKLRRKIKESSRIFSIENVLKEYEKMFKETLKTIN
ncbi:MAG: glycosyltransferase family 4 protein [Candidatus Micrarchaeales archaeon]